MLPFSFARASSLPESSLHVSDSVNLEGAPPPCQAPAYRALLSSQQGTGPELSFAGKQ